MPSGPPRSGLVPSVGGNARRAGGFLMRRTQAERDELRVFRGKLGSRIWRRPEGGSSSMKSQKHIPWGCLTLLCAFLCILGVYVTNQYLGRPYFAGRFLLVAWEWPKLTTVGKELDVWYDQHDRVLLVTRLRPDESRGFRSEWWPICKRVDRFLRIQRPSSDIVREIEWRRDCLVFLDFEGNPIYQSLSTTDFDRILAGPSFDPRLFGDLVRRGVARIAEPGYQPLPPMDSPPTTAKGAPGKTAPTN